MYNFIKNILENNFSEEDKLKMLQDVATKKVTAEELAKIVTYLKSKQAIKLDLPDSIDIVGTGGSGLDRINTSTLTSLKLATMGIKVAKHGNNASSGKFGSFDLIERLGYKIPTTTEEVLKEYEEKNIAFLYAKKFFPFMKEFAQARIAYGKPTIFNILGPLLCPANSKHQMIGCSFEDKMELMIETCQILGKERVMIVRGEDGLDEVTITGKTKVYELKDGTIKDFYFTPDYFGFKETKLEDILEKDIEKKVEIAKKIIAGEKVGAYSDLVNINVLAAYYLLGKNF
ncbi:MAG: anthranilate phosphoribosyltransferase [Candidatus Gracilibacteria bacterium]|nr:anthranilate phosphoribosyltransferase [Candidatus Gracilibacteria bacterium]